jgi:hypothetical protein
MDAIEELMHANIENGQAIINAVAARILDPVSHTGYFDETLREHFLLYIYIHV